MNVVLAGYGGYGLDEFVEAIGRVVMAGLTAEEMLETFAAVWDELVETSPRSSISRPRAREYKHQGPRLKTRYGRPWSSWEAF